MKGNVSSNYLFCCMHDFERLLQVQVQVERQGRGQRLPPPGEETGAEAQAKLQIKE
jgi:hypothetical protein